MTLRLLLTAAALALLPTGVTPLAAQAAINPPTSAVALEKRVVLLPAARGRRVELSVWVTRAAAPRGVIVFGHGLGSRPDAYLPLLERLIDHGYDVVAPLAVDSMAYADRDKFDLQTGFGARVEDLMIARGYAAGAFAGLPQILAGHSYGSLFAMIGAGAKSPAGELKGPPVAGVLALSTPGIIPGVVAPDAYASLSAPLLLVTGTNDTVPGFVKDWHDHRLAFDTSPKGDKTLITVPGGNHEMIIKGDTATRDAVTLEILGWLDAHTARGGVAPLQAVAGRGRQDGPQLFTIETR